MKTTDANLTPADIEHEICDLKDVRIALDTQLTIVKEMKPSRERSLAITKLQEADMWLDTDLKRLDALRDNP